MSKILRIFILIGLATVLTYMSVFLFQEGYMAVGTVCDLAAVFFAAAIVIVIKDKE